TAFPRRWNGGWQASPRAKKRLQSFRASCPGSQDPHGRASDELDPGDKHRDDDEVALMAASNRDPRKEIPHKPHGEYKTSVEAVLEPDGPERSRHVIPVGKQQTGEERSDDGNPILENDVSKAEQRGVRDDGGPTAITEQRTVSVKEKGSVHELLRQHRHDRRSEEHTSELQSREKLVCRLLLEKKKH